MPLRLVFPYFGVITDLLQCCGLCSELHSLALNIFTILAVYQGCKSPQSRSCPKHVVFRQI